MAYYNSGLFRTSPLEEVQDLEPLLRNTLYIFSALNEQVFGYSLVFYNA